MQIKLTSVYVDDQEKALRFYTDVLGFQKKDDVTNGPYRWLTVVSPEDQDGVQLQLALNDNPVAQAYQQGLYEQGQPAAMFHVRDLQGEYERMAAKGVRFTVEPMHEDWGSMTVLDDTCGNLIQLTQPAW